MAKVINIDKAIHTFEEKAPKQAAKIEYYIDENECHICVSHALDKDKYPRVHRYGKDLRMSRYIWSLANHQEIPQGLLVMHKCDNPKCINPEHLKLGTHLENMRDKKEKGRCRKGSKHPGSLLTEVKVYYIKFEAKDKSNYELAKMFNVKPATVKDIRRCKSWAHVTEDLKELSSKIDSAA